MRFEPLVPRLATQMSPAEDKFNLNCLEILNNVGHHTPNKQSVDCVLQSFLCVDSDVEVCESSTVSWFIFALGERESCVPKGLLSGVI